MKKSANDKIILELKAQIEVKKKLIRGTERFSPKTNCNLVLGSERYNLNVVSKQECLLLLARLKSLKDGLQSVLPDEILEISGYNVDLWIADLVNRFAVLNRLLESNKLEGLEQKLHNLLSLDTKVELEIEDLKRQI
jgi:hypothetical protein